MDNFTLVRPEHLSHHGYLFGGGPMVPSPLEGEGQGEG